MCNTLVTPAQPPIEIAFRRAPLPPLTHLYPNLDNQLEKHLSLVSYRGHGRETQNPCIYAGLQATAWLHQTTAECLA